jgi:hypothetical protein
LSTPVDHEQRAQILPVQRADRVQALSAVVEPVEGVERLDDEFR